MIPNQEESRGPHRPALLTGIRELVDKMTTDMWYTERRFVPGLIRQLRHSVSMRLHAWETVLCLGCEVWTPRVVDSVTVLCGHKFHQLCSSALRRGGHCGTNPSSRCGQSLWEPLTWRLPFVWSSRTVYYYVKFHIINFKTTRWMGGCGDRSPSERSWQWLLFGTILFYDSSYHHVKFSSSIELLIFHITLGGGSTSVRPICPLC